MGETRVDLQHLLEDLRDAYAGATEATILTEIVANALDSRATTIAISTEPAVPALNIVDDGAGMRRRELARYHDIAASSKVRGDGIGFAGVGIKIALLVCTEVLTETRRGRHHVASSWRLASRNRAPWHWVAPAGRVASRGTAVRLVPENALSPLVDPGFIEGALRRAFQSLFEPALIPILSQKYPRGVVFLLNGRALDPHGAEAPEVAPLAIRVGRKRKPVGAGYLVRMAETVPEDFRGIAVSTFGKVIRRGWDWLALTPGSADRIAGVIEVPALAESLTLNKADFIRAGARGAIYLAYRKAIQEAIAHQLSLWGDAGDPGERTRRRAARPVERDLEAVLADLAEEFPLLAPLVEQRAGGQRRLPVGGSTPGTLRRNMSPLTVPEAMAAIDVSEAATPELNAGEEKLAPPVPSAAAPGGVADGASTRRPVRYGLSIGFEARPDDPELARLVESTVWVNEAHPAYRRAAASRSEGYHTALAVALALATLAVDPAKEHAFITAFLASWGAAVERRRGRSASPVRS